MAMLSLEFVFSVNFGIFPLRAVIYITTIFVLLYYDVISSDDAAEEAEQVL